MKKYILILAILAVVGVGTYMYLLRPTEAPSVDVRTGQEPSSDSPSDTEVPSAKKRFVINAKESQASFAIGEVLRGEPFTAIGRTNHIAGEALFDFENPAQSTIGEIRVNARTIKTDSESRDRMIARFILKSETPENEFIVFTPKELLGLPDKIRVGQEVSFSIQGDLTIAGITRPATFKVKALFGETSMSATSTAIVKRADFNLTIPSVPSVASVEEEVTFTVAAKANLQN